MGFDAKRLFAFLEDALFCAGFNMMPLYITHKNLSDYAKHCLSIGSYISPDEYISDKIGIASLLADHKYLFEKDFPEIHQALTSSLEDLGLLICSDDAVVKKIVSYRLEHRR